MNDKQEPFTPTVQYDPDMLVRVADGSTIRLEDAIALTRANRPADDGRITECHITLREGDDFLSDMLAGHPWEIRGYTIIPNEEAATALRTQSDAEVERDKLKYELRQLKPYTDDEVEALQKAMDYGWQIPANPPGKDEMLELAAAFMAERGEHRKDGA